MSTTSSDANTTYILVTGANSGLGFSICCRLIDEFLPTRPDSHSLTLIPTTRSSAKADDTVTRLNAHLDKYCQAAESAVFGAGVTSHSRINIQPELVDLCDLVSVRRVAKSLRQKYDRLDVVILNAGIGGWIGVDWMGAVKQFLKEGMGIVHRPAFKIGSLGKVVKSRPLTDGRDAPQLGEIFCANVFGHYLLVHYLMGVLSRKSWDGGSEVGGRVVWVSTLEAYAKTFSLDDFQGIGNSLGYESSKRLTDLMVLTSRSEGTEKYTQNTTPTKPPTFYLSHPGICATEIMPIPRIMVFFQVCLLYLARFFGSPWHTTTSYAGATSMVWLALAEEKVLKERDARNAKWGSAVNWIGSERVKLTNVDGYAGEDGSLLRDENGRGEFEKTGVEVWEEMEGLREEWEKVLGEEGWE
ncbi:hypothetical protein EJ08DRAFT_671800 [Tothia fuscella]|uniref:3-keto-steroid reductase n=1 Tax=Tothia fuscella TaxID=1048955 RepID=A0A9P4NLK1_9PEZI|nr:hypothetical protein EJ08DRAFT_671800 [Tothia fuscella]